MMRRFAALVLCLVFCCTMIPAALADEPSGVEDGVLTVAMECNYAPYNWSQGDDSNGAVPIRDSREYANGYDVMMAKKLCEANGWQLEIVRLDWDSLVPAVQAGVVDAVIAGQSMTASRAEMVDFAGPYLYASIVCLAKQGTPQAAAKGISELSGYCTSQMGTIWYDSCLPQIKDVDLQAPADTAPAMIMALQTGTVDFICTDMPTAMGAAATDENLVILNFSGTDGDFQSVCYFFPPKQTTVSTWAHSRYPKKFSGSG